MLGVLQVSFPYHPTPFNAEMIVLRRVAVPNSID